jgi:phosphoribosylanthranilate isomerase
MSRIAVKICGLSKPETLDAALKGGASHVGLVHFAKSPRHVEAERLAALAARVPGQVQKVGVVVNPDDAMIEMLMQAGRLDALQLHGSRAARARGGDPRAFSGVETLEGDPGQDFDGHHYSATRYADIADLILFDAKTPDHADLPGGMGLRFDWSLLSAYRATGPWGLSGGLDPDNVTDPVHSQLPAHPARRARAFRPVRRALCRRNADAADPRSREGISRRQADPAFQAEFDDLLNIMSGAPARSISQSA